MQKPYVQAANLLNGMSKINQFWYTQEDQVSPLSFKMTKEHMEKDQDREQNRVKIKTQIHIFSKNGMGDCVPIDNVVGVGFGNLDESKFEALYNEEVNLQTTKAVHIVQTTRKRVVTKIGIDMKV